MSVRIFTYSGKEPVVIPNDCILLAHEGTNLTERHLSTNHRGEHVITHDYFRAKADALLSNAAYPHPQTLIIDLENELFGLTGKHAVP